MSATNEVRRANLRIAQARRLERVELLREVRGRRVNPRGLIEDPPECLRDMLAFEFLLDCPRIGREALRAINRLALREDVNLAVPLRSLCVRERLWLGRVVASRVGMLASCPQG